MDSLFSLRNRSAGSGFALARKLPDRRVGHDRVRMRDRIKLFALFLFASAQRSRQLLLSGSDYTPTQSARLYTQVCFRVVIPAGMPDPLEREANPVPWTVTRNSQVLDQREVLADRFTSLCLGSGITHRDVGNADIAGANICPCRNPGVSQALVYKGERGRVGTR